MKGIMIGKDFLTIQDRQCLASRVGRTHLEAVTNLEEAFGLDRENSPKLTLLRREARATLSSARDSTSVPYQSRFQLSYDSNLCGQAIIGQ